MTKKAKQIRDRDISEANYSKFALCEIMRGGLAVCFKYPSGAAYEVDVSDILSWFTTPHYQCTSAGVKNWLDKRSYRPPACLRVRAARRVLGGHALRLRMSDDTAYDVAWDTVLMACEPRYEWYGGLPEKVKAKM